MPNGSKSWTPTLLDLWAGALITESAGLAIKTNDRRLLQSQLYRARQAEGTKEMEDLAICIPAVEDEVWIVKKSVLESEA